MEQNTEPDLKPANKKTIFLNIALIIFIFVGLFTYMIFVDGLDNILNLLTKVNYLYVLGGLFCLIMMWLFNGMCLHIPLKKLYPNQHFFNSLRVSMIGQLFNNITPFSSGGQPMQAYELTKTGKKASDSMSALTIQFIVSQIALILLTHVIALFEFKFFINLFKDFLFIAILGFSVNIVLIIVVILAGINKKMITCFTTPFIKLLGKLRIVKNTDELIEKVDNSIQNFNNQFKFMAKQKKTVIQIFILACIQNLFYYGITYMVYKAFGNSGINFLQIVPVQAFLLLIMTVTPTPGAGIGAEGGFFILFSSIFKEGTINMSILFWRIYTFYLPILIGALFLIPFKQKNIPK